MSRRTFRKSFTCLFFCGMRLSRSGSKVRRDPAITAATATITAMRMICLLRRKQRSASASRILSIKESGDNMRTGSSQGLAIASLLVLAACQPREPLTAAKAEQILRAYMFQREPVYAEVPQKVWWDERHPKDDFDEKSVRTFRNLERAGYVTVFERSDSHGSIYTAKVTDKGFHVLGTSPSMRG